MKNGFRYAGFVLLFAVLGGGVTVLSLFGWPLAFRYQSSEGTHWLIWPYLIDMVIYAVLPVSIVYVTRDWIWIGKRRVFSAILLVCWLGGYVGLTTLAVRHAQPSLALVMHFGNESLESKRQELSNQPFQDSDVEWVKASPTASNAVCKAYYESVEQTSLPISLIRNGLFVSTNIEKVVAEKWIKAGLACDDTVVNAAKRVRDDQYSRLFNAHLEKIALDLDIQAAPQEMAGLLRMGLFLGLLAHPDALDAAEDSGSLYRLVTKGALKPHIWHSVAKLGDKEIYVDARTWLVEPQGNQDLIGYFAKLTDNSAQEGDTLFLYVVDCKNKQAIKKGFTMMNFEKSVENSLSVTLRHEDKGFAVDRGAALYEAHVFVCNDKSNQIKVDVKGWTID